MTDPTTALREAMAQHNLDPGPTIDWSGKLNYFRVEGDGRSEKGGRYVAHLDKPVSAWFKNWRVGFEVKWRMDTDEEIGPERKAELVEILKKREAEQEARAKKAAERYQKVWDAADPPDLQHPYLVRKGLPAAPGIRQSKGHLLVPMRSFEKGNPISSLQSISLDGKKRFAPSGRAAGTRMTIGSKTLKEKGGVIYLVEGWATGVSVHLATSCPVIVCFFAGNLLSVARSLREKFPKQHLVVCADNDYWSSTPNGRNPGLRAATWAAKETSADVALPEFQNICEDEDCDKSCDLGHPTDFDDLRQLEGLDAVRKWLDPAPTPEDAPPPSIEDPTPGEEPPPPEEPIELPERWYETAPFRCLGYEKGGLYHYHPVGTGQIVSLTPGQHDRKTLLPLAPLSWWQRTFPGQNGISWLAAADALFQASHRAGVFNPKRARGRGAWPERDPDGKMGVLIHLGDRMIVPGSKKMVTPDEYVSPGHHVYERQERMDGPSMDPMKVEESRVILELFRGLLWMEPASADLLAGWVTLAPVCGALAWRPHVWVTGEMGCGKTSVFDQLLQPLMGGVLCNVKGGTTEAGIRGELKSDAFPVLFDEAEESEGVGTNIQRVLALARQASSDTDARVIKGTRTGGTMQYMIRSMFCLASIGGAVYQESDRSRVCMLHLQGASQLDPKFRKAHWDAYQPRLQKLVDVEAGRRLIARTLKLLRNGMLYETVKIFRSESSTVLKDQRMGDQYGTLYAGCWALQSDEPPDPQVVREMVGSENLQSYQDDRQPEGLKALRMLLQTRERVDTPNGIKTYAVGQLVEACMGRGSELSDADATKVLRQLGLRVEVDDGEYVLLVANQSEWISKVLEGTIYSRGIRTVLMSLPEVSNESRPVKFHTGLQSRSSVVPMSIIDAI